MTLYFYIAGPALILAYIGEIVFFARQHRKGRKFKKLYRKRLCIRLLTILPFELYMVGQLAVELICDEHYGGIR